MELNLRQIVNELSFGDAQNAMKLLYMHYYPKLLLFVSYYIKSKHEAEDIVSDSFFSIWEQRGKLFKVQNINTYVYAIAKNTTFDFMKKKEKAKKHIQYDISETEYLVKSQSTPESDFIKEELIDRLDEAIESLPLKNKIAFKLIREQRLKYKEAAEIMEISVKTLEAHITAAVKRLEKILDEEINL